MSDTAYFATAITYKKRTRVEKNMGAAAYFVTVSTVNLNAIISF
jgi:hypothetical protein